jgi:hypothetical protein
MDFVSQLTLTTDVTNLKLDSLVMAVVVLQDSLPSLLSEYAPIAQLKEAIM